MRSAVSLCLHYPSLTHTTAYKVPYTHLCMYSQRCTRYLNATCIRVSWPVHVQVMHVVINHMLRQIHLKKWLRFKISVFCKCKFSSIASITQFYHKQKNKVNVMHSCQSSANCYTSCKYNRPLEHILHENISVSIKTFYFKNSFLIQCVICHFFIIICEM